jgi:hypothetical protein
MYAGSHTREREGEILTPSNNPSDNWCAIERAILCDVTGTSSFLLK